MLGLGLLFSGSQPVVVSASGGTTISLLHADDLITADTIFV